jgi:hypothetical protein
MSGTVRLTSHVLGRRIVARNIGATLGEAAISCESPFRGTRCQPEPHRRGADHTGHAVLEERQGVQGVADV